MRNAHGTSHPLVRKLQSIFTLSEEEEQAIVALPMMVRTHAARQEIVYDGDRPSQCCVILEGLACRHKIISSGKRQILSFHVAGDMPDLQSLHLKVMDHGVGTITEVQAGFIAHDHIRHLIAHRPRIGSALWRDTLIDAAIFREWMFGLGRRDAPARMAHFFCELFTRMQAVGLTDELSCPMPVSQADLSDALGLSAVHVNRVLMDLRGRGLITLERKRLTILDWPGLVAAGGFDPLYLHLHPGS